MSQSTCVFCCCCYCCCFMRLPCKPFIFFYIGIQIILTKNWKLEIRRHQPFKIVKLLAKCLETKTFKLSLITISHYLLLSFIVTKRNWKEQKKSMLLLDSQQLYIYLQCKTILKANDKPIQHSVQLQCISQAPHRKFPSVLSATALT